MKEQFNYTTETVVTTTYTVLIDDQYIKAGGTSDYTITAFARSALISGESGKTIQIKNTGTGRVSFVPASGEFINNTAAGVILYPGDVYIFDYQYQTKSWNFTPDIDALDANFVLCVQSNGTTAVDVFGPGGAPRAFNVLHVAVSATDAVATNIVVAQTAGTIATIAKGTTDTALVGQTALTYTAVAQNAAVTVDGSDTGSAMVMIFGRKVILPAY